jgi:hypothetical protein
MATEIFRDTNEAGDTFIVSRRDKPTKTDQRENLHSVHKNPAGYDWSVWVCDFWKSEESGTRAINKAKKLLEEG